MSIEVVLFDLDGTLLPMDQEVFVRAYFGGISKRLAPYGYPPEKLIETIWKGTAAMVQNDGLQTNEAVFWKYFSSVFGEKSLADMPVFEAFYREDFGKVQASCGYDPMAAEVVSLLKAKGIRVGLATNPIFPAIATEQRIRWAGLKPSDFEFYTTYENASFCKPNPAYYQSILDDLQVVPEQCLMVGNDVTEDMVAQTLGMQVFLLTPCMINKYGKDISAYPQGDFSDLLKLFS